MTAIAIIRKVGGLIFDATFSENHRSSIEVTENPVDIGIMISDHAFAKPKSLSLVAGVSDTPLKQQTNDQFSSGDGRSKKAFELLKTLQKSFEPFNIQTGLELYKNMMCIEVQCVQDADTSRAFVFNAEFREVIITSTQVISLPLKTEKLTATKKKSRLLGKRQPKEVTNEVKQGNLKTLFDTMKTT
jgi:hypothetical protein